MERKSPFKILPLFLFFFAFSLFLILAENLGWLRVVRSFTEELTVPIGTLVYRSWQDVGLSFGAIGSIGTNTKKIAELESELRNFASLKVTNQALEEENKALRRQLEAPLPASMQFLPAKTLGKTRYLTIDKGESNGVRVGMMVISENVLIGKIISLTPKTSDVLLLSDPDSKVSARTLKTQTHGLAQGEFGTSIFLDKVLQADTLEEGDLVVTTGDDDYIRDLLIGKIGKIEKKEVEPFQSAEILPLIDYGKLVDIFVVK